MNKTSLLILLVASLFFGCEAKNKKQYANNVSTVESILEENASALLKDKRFHSLSVGIYKDGKTITKHFGELEIGKGNLPNDTTIYEIASVTKTFLGTLTAKAVLEQKINLNDDIRSYLEQPYPNLEFNGKAITIQDVLTHTSGFPNFPIKGDTKQNFFEGLKEIKIEDEIGTVYAYSNTAPEVMAFILEKVYGKPYEMLVKEYIVAPNEMKRTKFDLSEFEKKSLVQGYNGENELMPNFERNLWGGTVGLHSTMADMLKYIAYHLEDANEIIKESHKDFLETPYDFNIGYYWNIIKTKDEVVYRHHGGIFGMQNWLMIYPKQNMGISIFTNCSFDETGELLEEVATNICAEVAKIDLSDK
ncbi:serine hydrolase domain-containing protein [Spongiimicrobium sp. 3-5]|uniref:serine hydrolase domain-containing protein n=1 Tax=Spongiimicrobium sp. 3-5 TaxID=3332596 RepID=UPI00397F15F3